MKKKNRSRKIFLAGWAATSLITAILLTDSISQVGTSTISTLFKRINHTPGDPYIRIAALGNYGNVGDVTLSNNADSAFENLFGPTIISLDISVGASESQIFLIDHVRQCVPHLKGGKVLPYADNTHRDSNPLVTVDFIETSDTAIIKMIPLVAGDTSFRYYVKCNLELESSGLRIGFSRRNLNILYSRVDELTQRALGHEGEDRPDSEYLHQQIVQMLGSDTRLFVKDIVMFQKFIYSTNMDIDGGKTPNVAGEQWDASHERELDSTKNQRELSYYWDDIRYLQYREIILVLIGSLVGISIGFFIEYFRPDER